jgi:predicted esterase
MRNTLRAIPALIVLLIAALQVPSQAQPVDTAIALKLKDEVAGELVSIADAASDNKLNGRAEALLKEALALAPEHKKAKKALDKLADTQDTDDSEAVTKFEKKAEKYNKRAAMGYTLLFAELEADKDTQTVSGWLTRAYQLHKETANDFAEKRWREHYGAKRYTQAHRLLDLALPFPVEEEKQNTARAAAMLECEGAISAKSPILKSCTSHPMKYYLSLPEGWTATKKWPVYVAVEGAGSNFLGAIGGARGNGNDTFIIVTPCGFTNTNAMTDDMRKKYPYTKEVIDKADEGRMAFDEPGMLAILDDLKASYGAQDKACITGFSGGGILTWFMVFTHPEKLLAAVPACANFAGVREVSDNAEAKKALIIHAYQGDKDEYKESMLDGQWQAAEKLAKENGYEHVTRDTIPGGHIGCHAQAREVFLKALEK